MKIKIGGKILKINKIVFRILKQLPLWNADASATIPELKGKWIDYYDFMDNIEMDKLSVSSRKMINKIDNVVKKCFCSCVDWGNVKSPKASLKWQIEDDNRTIAKWHYDHRNEVYK